MINDLVKGAMESLVSRWRELRDALEQLQKILAEDGGTADTALDTLIEHCIKEGGSEDAPAQAGRILDELGHALTLRPAIKLIEAAIKSFILSDKRRESASIQFTTAFPLSASGDDLLEVRVCRDQLERLQGFINSSLQELESITSIHGERFNVNGIRGSVEKLAAYPILTADFVAGSAPSSASPAQGGGSFSLQKSIEGAMREVLGRVPKANDPRSFVAALTQSFQITTVSGRVELAWTPRSFAGQTDLGGGVTGAQASLYTRAKIALDNALPLLDGLYPLLPEADPELLDAARSIVRNKLIEVVNELGVEGGPRRTRVDNLFFTLLEENVTDEEGTNSQTGYLGYLEEVFGLTPDQVNTLDEETNTTNFIVLRDYITSLQVSWATFRDDLYGKDLGTRLVLLSRALSVAAESVGEVYAAMDSVYVGAAERQVSAFPGLDGRPIIIEELLSWIVSFTSDEAPRLIYEGGRRGVAAIFPTVQLLEKLTRRFIQSIPHEPSLPEGLRHPRVLNPLQELRAYLERVQQLAQDVRR